MGAGYYLAADVAAETHLFTVDDGSAGEAGDRVDLTLRARLLTGRRF